MSSKGRSASGSDGGTPTSTDMADAPDRLIALEHQLLHRIDRADRLSDDLIASKSELARKEALLVVTLARADSAEREQAHSAGRAAAILDEVAQRREEAASMGRDLATIADRIARAEREADARTRHAELIATETKDLRKRLADKDQQLVEARTLLAEAKAQGVREASAPVPSPVQTVAASRPLSLRERLGPFAILAAPLLLFRKRPKAAKGRPLPPPSSDQEAMDLIARSDLFDAEWYLNKYPDIRGAGVEPVHHYFHHGGIEGRKPGPRFDPKWYSQHARGLSGNPLIHYLTQGRAQGIEIPALKDAPVHDHPDVLEVVNSPLFDAEWYRAKQPGLPKGRENVAHHYLTSGWLNGLQPGPAFDGDAYLQRYEDVREAGANPLLHYLRHGHGERRQAFPVQGDGSPRRRSSVQDRREHSVETVLLDEAFAPTHADDATTDQWIWVKADDFGDAGEGQIDVRLGDTLIGRSMIQDGDLSATLKTFARLSGLVAFDDPTCALRFGTGAARLVRDAWFLTSLDLRLRLVVPHASPCVVRVYQVALGEGGVARLQETAFDPASVTVVDVTLLNPFSPVLLCVDDGYGVLSDASVLCFPSLARGGLHHGELVAADAQDDLGGHDSDLAKQWLSTAVGPLAISTVEVDLDGVIGGEAIFGRPLQEWLKAAMRVSVTPRLRGKTVDANLRDATDGDAVAFGPERPTQDGVTLIIPGDGIPTLAALVSRSPRVFADDGPGPVIVADTVRSRPRWHVTPPKGVNGLLDLQPRTGGNPWPAVRGALGLKAPSDIAPLPPLAIRFRENIDAANDRLTIFPFAPDMAEPLLMRAPAARPGRISVILNLSADSEADDVSATITSLATQDHGGSLELLIVSSEPNPEALALAQLHYAQVRMIVDSSSSAARLNAGAKGAKGRLLLFVEAGMVLHDQRTLATLVTIASTAGVASVGCATIQAASGTGIGRNLALHSAGVFPDQIAFRRGPQLMLGEPTTAAAMAPATYAVAANRFRLTLVTRTAWEAVGALDVTMYPEADYDLDFGVRALKQGLIHVCTSVVSATRLAGAPLGRPGALLRAPLSIDDWGVALARMTIVRALG